jgi:hypothetical protein
MPNTRPSGVAFLDPLFENVTLTGVLTESSAVGITAGTTRTQAGATQLTKEVNNVTTATSPVAGTVLGDGVALPGPTSVPPLLPVLPGQDYKVINNTPYPIQVYTELGDLSTINGVAGSTGVALPRGDVAIFIYTAPTTPLGAGTWNYEPAMGANGQLLAELAADSIAANATGTQVAATVLPIAEMIHVITAANASAPYSAVAIPVLALPGTELYIENNAANPVQIFPIIGGTDQINGLGANNSIVLPAVGTVIVACTLTGSWVTNPYYNAVGAYPGSIPTQMGASTAATGSARPGGNINVPTYSSVGQGNGADTTDDVLATFALPANIFDIAGRQVSIAAMGKFASNGNNKTIKVWFGTTTQTLGAAVAGGTMIATSGVVTTNAGGWTLTAQVTKYGVAGSNTQVGQGAIVAGGTHTGTSAPTATTAAENAVINITVTGASGTSGAANDVVVQMLQVSFSN